MMISRDRRGYKEKNWMEMLVTDTSFPEKLIVIAWCGFPYIIWVMTESLDIWYRVITSLGIWLFLSLLCYWFGNFMGSDERHWN